MSIEYIPVSIFLFFCFCQVPCPLSAYTGVFRRSSSNVPKPLLYVTLLIYIYSRSRLLFVYLIWILFFRVGPSTHLNVIISLAFLSSFLLILAWLESMCQIDIDWHIDRPTDRQTDRPTDRQTDRPTDRQNSATDRHTDRLTNWQIDKRTRWRTEIWQTDRVTDCHSIAGWMLTYSLSDRLSNKMIDILIDWLASWLTDRRETDRRIDRRPGG